MKIFTVKKTPAAERSKDDEKKKMKLTHLLEVHLLPVNAFEKLMLLHLRGSACVHVR